MKWVRALFDATPRLGIVVVCQSFQMKAPGPTSYRQALGAMIRPARRRPGPAGTSGRKACCRAASDAAA
jgi:hypothetical protein